MEELLKTQLIIYDLFIELYYRDKFRLTLYFLNCINNEENNYEWSSNRFVMLSGWGICDNIIS